MPRSVEPGESGFAMDLTVEEARDILLLLVEGGLTETADPTKDALSHARRRAIRAFFRLLARFAEAEPKASFRSWRDSVAAWVEDRPCRTDVSAVALLRNSPLDFLLGISGEDCCYGCRPSLSPVSLLLAADALSRKRGPLDTWEWTEFHPLSPRDLGRLYEGFTGGEPAPVPAGCRSGGARLQWVENDPQRKVSGSYYTPEAITRHIVASALEPLLASRQAPDPDEIGSEWNPKSLSPIRELPSVLDPAMGCGYFLLDAVQYLYEWVRRSDSWRGAEDAKALALRRTIAVHCLYGVDKDPLAAELARLAISCWVAGGIVSSPQPEMERNLRVGNSLVGSVKSPADPDSNPPRESRTPPKDRLPASRHFLWSAAFPGLFDHASDLDNGFDAVIGNPPYDNSRGGLDRNPDLAEAASYARASGEYRIKGAVDLYRLFLQRSLQLCRTGGVVSMIVPRTLLGDRDSALERDQLLRETEILSIDDFPSDDASRRVFASASTAVCILTCRKGRPTGSFPINRWNHGPMKGEAKTLTVQAKALERFWPGYLPFVGLDDAEWRVLCKLHDSPGLCPLSEIAEGGIGEANSGYHREFMVGEDTGALLIRGSDVSPYHIQTNGHGHKRWIDRDGYLASLSEAARTNLKWDRTRVVKQAVRNISLPKRLIAGLSEPGWFLADSTDFFVARPPYDSRYLLALLNSRTVPEWLFRLVSTNNNVNLYQVRHLPVPQIDFEITREERERRLEEALRVTKRRIEEGIVAHSSGEGSEWRRVRSLWGEWLDGWLEQGRRDYQAMPAAAHDLLVWLSQEMIGLRRCERDTLTILNTATDLQRRSRVLTEFIDLIIWRMYGLNEEEAALVTASLRER